VKAEKDISWQAFCIWSRDKDQFDYCAVKAPGLNGNSATILPFSPSHSIVERQLNAI
jgi:hypothetical protein